MKLHEVVLVCFQDYKRTSSIEKHVDNGKVKPHATSIKSERESWFPLTGMISSGFSDTQI